MPPDNLKMFDAAVLDHFERPRNAGELENPTASVEVTNPVCGDVLHLTVRVQDGRVSEVKFKTRGCVTSIAASSALTELIRGKSRAEISAITPEEISAALGGLPPATFHGAQLAADAAAALVPKLPR
ncbi:MAG TPA: iron-sulfur cluster assembly scaffold protein [Candidatus Acidoferrales bacterium]|nr:iron-sulfur cluster assembly scaffold protein [Candidatus Acidoferrales bacterium]